MGESTDTIVGLERVRAASSPPGSLAELLSQHKADRGIGDAKIATLASDRAGIDGYVTRSTVRNWAAGSSASVNNWRQLACIASALQLDQEQADRLMLAGGCDRVTDLRRVAREDDERFVAFWEDSAPVVVPTNFDTPAPLTQVAPSAPAAASNRWAPLLFVVLGVLIAAGIWFLIGSQRNEAAAGSGDREIPETSPVTGVDLPADGSTIGPDIVVSGTAEHRDGIEHVELIVKNNDEATYWNPVAGRWQEEFVRFVVPVEPGPTFAAWQYRLPVPVTSGSYRARAWARSASGSGDPIGPMSNFTVESELALNLSDGASAAPDGANQLIAPPPDDGFPQSTLDSPVPGEVTASTVVVSGTATDPEGIAYVELVFRDLDRDRYWNPAIGGWQDDFTRFAIDVDQPGTDLTTWSFTHPDELFPGSYRARVWATSSTGGRDEERTLSDFVVE